MIIARNKVTGMVVKCNPTHPQDCYWTLDKRVWVFTEETEQTNEPLATLNIYKRNLTVGKQRHEVRGLQDLQGVHVGFGPWVGLTA